MDFYFINNLIRIDYEGILLQQKNSDQNWKVMGIGFPYLTFNFDNMSFIFEVYEKTTDKKMFQIDLSKTILEGQEKQFGFIFFDETQKNYKGFTFMKNASFFIFMNNFNSYKDIENKYIKTFCENSENINFKICYFKNYLNTFEIKKNYNYGAFLPFIYVMFQDYSVFTHVFESYFSEYYMKWRIHRDWNSLHNTNKIIKITANLFIIVNNKCLRKLLLTGFFTIIIDLINAKQKIDGIESESYEEFLGERREFLKAFMFSKFSKEDIEFFNRLQYVIKYLLTNEIDEKYLQIYSSLITKKNVDIWKDILKSKSNISLIAKETQEKSVCLFFYFLELVMNLKKQKDLLIKIFELFKFCDLMDKMILHIKEINFVRLENFLILEPQNKFLKKKENLLMFLDFFSILINANNKCFFKIFLSPEESLNGYNKLKTIFYFHFQENYTDLQFISLGLLTCVFNNFGKIKDNPNKYYKILVKIIWHNLNNYDNIRNKKCLFFLDLIIKKKLPLVLQSFLKNKDFCLLLIKNFKSKNNMVWFYTINVLGYFLIEIKDEILLKKIFNTFLGYFNKKRKLTLIGCKILSLVKEGAEKKIFHFQAFFIILNNILENNFSRDYIKTINFNFFTSS